jgi:colicin import membrane protein
MVKRVRTICAPVSGIARPALAVHAACQVQAAEGYAGAAATAYGAFLQRIAAATEQLGRRDDGADAEIVGMVTTMLAEHPWRRRGPA